MPDKANAAIDAAAGCFPGVVETADTMDGIAPIRAFRQRPLCFFEVDGPIGIDGTLSPDVGPFQTKPPRKGGSRQDVRRPVRSVSAFDIGYATRPGARLLSS